MSAWASAVSDVRKILSDGPTDKISFEKKVIGIQNSLNLKFKTFEARRVSSFVTPTGVAGVFNNGAIQTVATEDLESGQFILAASPPANGDTFRATYYYQWFDDVELIEFLTDASEWIMSSPDYLSIPESLRPAAKEYAAHKAYQKLVSKMAVNLAETYQLYDAPDQKRFDPIAAYMKISESKYKIALQLRNDVYDGRKGQALAPLSRSLAGSVRDVPPNR